MLQIRGSFSSNYFLCLGLQNITWSISNTICYPWWNWSSAVSNDEVSRSDELPQTQNDEHADIENDISPQQLGEIPLMLDNLPQGFKIMSLTLQNIQSINACHIKMSHSHVANLSTIFSQNEP